MLDAMAKDQVVNIRMEAVEKAALRAAARRRGQTLSAFLLESAILRAAQAPGIAEPLDMFKTACTEAAAGGGGYQLAGQVFLRAARGFPDYDALQEALNETEVVLGPGSDGSNDLWDFTAALEWIQEHHPEYLVHVPERRRALFLDAVYDAWQNDLEGLDRDAVRHAVEQGYIDPSDFDAETQAWLDESDEEE